MSASSSLTDLERSIYEWQLWVTGFGEAGQEKLKRASVLVSRCGGVGGAAALQLAAAGVGRLVIAHGGNLKPSDLNRQVLMTADWIGRPRIQSIERRLRAFNPWLEVVGVPENVSAGNVQELVRQADLVLDCAPLFQERYLLNAEAVRQKKPLIECAMFELEGQVTTVLPGQTSCLACLYPTPPPDWRRQFPVFGAVAGTIGCLGAMEAIKLLAGLGQTLAGRLLTCDLRSMTFRLLNTHPDPRCPVCGPNRSDSTPCQ